jgi:hypothetical protein
MANEPTLHIIGGIKIDSHGEWKEKRLKECFFELTCDNRHDCYNCNSFEIWERITPWDRQKTILKDGKNYGC